MGTKGNNALLNITAGIKNTHFLPGLVHHKFLVSLNSKIHYHVKMRGSWCVGEILQEHCRTFFKNQ